MRVLTSVNVLAEFPPVLTNVNPSPAVPLCRLLQVALTCAYSGGGTHRKKSPALRSRLGRFFLGAVSREKSGGACEGSSIS